MADRIIHPDFIQFFAVAELHGQGIGDGTLRRIVIVAGKLRVLDADHLFPQHIYSRIKGNRILVVGGAKSAENEAHGNNVLNAVIAVGVVVERPFLVDDADRSLLRREWLP